MSDVSVFITCCVVVFKAVFEVSKEKGLLLMEVFDGVSVEDIRAATGSSFEVHLLDGQFYIIVNDPNTGFQLSQANGTNLTFILSMLLCSQPSFFSLSCKFCAVW